VPAVALLTALTAAGCGKSSDPSPTVANSGAASGASVVRGGSRSAGPAVTAGKHTPLVSNVQIGTIRARCVPSHSPSNDKATLALRAYAEAPDEIVVVSVAGHRIARKNIHDGGRLAVQVPLEPQSGPGTFTDQTPPVTWTVAEESEPSSLRARVVMRVTSKVGGGCEPTRLTLRLANHSHGG
jgi:hypothetical protein